MRGFLVEAVALGLPGVRIRIVRRLKEAGAQKLRELVRLQIAVGGHQRQGLGDPGPGLAREHEIGREDRVFGAGPELA